MIQLWQEMELSEQQEIFLIAVGGYGRRDMFPLSDLDFFDFSRANPQSLRLKKKLLNLSNFMGLWL